MDRQADILTNVDVMEAAKRLVTLFKLIANFCVHLVE